MFFRRVYKHGGREAGSAEWCCSGPRSPAEPQASVGASDIGTPRFWIRKLRGGSDFNSRVSHTSRRYLSRCMRPSVSGCDHSALSILSIEVLAHMPNKHRHVCATRDNPAAEGEPYAALPSTSPVRLALSRKRGTLRVPGAPRFAPSDRRSFARLWQWHRRRR